MFRLLLLFAIIAISATDWGTGVRAGNPGPEAVCSVQCVGGECDDLSGQNLMAGHLCVESLCVGGKEISPSPPNPCQEVRYDGKGHSYTVHKPGCCLYDDDCKMLTDAKNYGKCGYDHKCYIKKRPAMPHGLICCQTDAQCVPFNEDPWCLEARCECANGSEPINGYCPDAVYNNTIDPWWLVNTTGYDKNGLPYKNHHDHTPPPPTGFCVFEPKEPACECQETSDCYPGGVVGPIFKPANETTEMPECCVEYVCDSAHQCVELQAPIEKCEVPEEQECELDIECGESTEDAEEILVAEECLNITCETNVTESGNVSFCQELIDEVVWCIEDADNDGFAKDRTDDCSDDCNPTLHCRVCPEGFIPDPNNGTVRTECDCDDEDPDVNPGVTDFFDCPTENDGFDWDCSCVECPWDFGTARCEYNNETGECLLDESDPRGNDKWALYQPGEEAEAAASVAALLSMGAGGNNQHGPGMDCPCTEDNTGYLLQENENSTVFVVPATNTTLPAGVLNSTYLDDQCSHVTQADVDAAKVFVPCGYCAEWIHSCTDVDLPSKNSKKKRNALEECPENSYAEGANFRSIEVQKCN